MVVMHTYLLRHMAGENRGQCLDKCTRVGRTRVGGHKNSAETEASCRLLLSYLLLLLLLFLLLLLVVVVLNFY